MANKVLVIENVENLLHNFKLNCFFQKTFPDTDKLSSSHTSFSNSTDRVIPVYDESIDHRDSLKALGPTWTPEIMDPSVNLFSTVVTKELMQKTI